MNQITCPISEGAQKYPDQPVILFGARAIVYAQLDQYVWATVKYLKKLGVASGGRVALVQTNCVESVIILLALWRMGAVACLLSTRLPEENLIEQLRKLNVPVILSSLPEIISSKKFRIRTFPLTQVINFDVRDFPIQETSFIPLDQEATILFTSGSSGEAKAVVHTYGNHYQNARGANANMPLQPGDRWLLSLPLYHVGGLGILFRVFLSGAAAVIPAPDLELSEAITKYRISHISLVPTQLYRILEKRNQPNPCASLKAILLGGSGIPALLLQKAIEHQWPVYPTYGLTEMSSQVATCAEAVRDFTRLQVKVLNGRQIKISPQGEIWVQGETLCKGYLIQDKIVLPLNEEGWFPTGDLGEIDDQGNLTVKGRMDRMFISGGENIQPEEIEKRLCEIETIAAAVVIPVTDEEFGFRPVAFVRLQDDCQIDLKEIRIYLEKILPRFKIPDAFYLWPEEESTIKGIKVDRRLLQDFLFKKSNTIRKIS